MEIGSSWSFLLLAAGLLRAIQVPEAGAALELLAKPGLPGRGIGSEGGGRLLDVEELFLIQMKFLVLFSGA